MTINTGPQIVDITKGSLVNKLLRHGSIYLFSRLVLGFTSLLLLPINTRLFSQTEYGAIATIDAVTQLLGVFVSLSIGAAYTIYYHEYKSNPDQLRRYTSTLYWFTIACGIVVVAGTLMLPNSFFKEMEGISVWPVLTFAFFGPLLLQLGQIGSGYLQQNHRSILQVALNLVFVFVHVVIMMILVGVFDLGLTGKYIAVFCGAGIFALISSWILFRAKLLGFDFSTPMLKESLIFSIPLIPNIAGGWITGLSDRIILSWYGPLAETGIYNVGYTLGRGITIFSEAIFMVYGPMIYAMLKKEQSTTKIQLERFVAYFFMFMLWIFLALSLFAKEMIALTTPDEYASAATILPVVLFAYFLGGQYKVFANIVSAKRKTWVISSGAILMAVVNFGANLIFIPLFGKIAAAWTTVLGVGIYLIWLLAWSQKNFYLQLDYMRMATAAIIFGILGGAGVFLTQLPFFTASQFASLTLKGILWLAAIGLLWVSGCILPLDKQRLKTQVMKVIKA